MASASLIWNVRLQPVRITPAPVASTQRQPISTHKVGQPLIAGSDTQGLALDDIPVGVAVEDSLETPLLEQEQAQARSIPDDMTVIHCSGCGTLLQASSEGTTVQCVLCDTLTPIGGPPPSSSLSLIPGGAWLSRQFNGMVGAVTSSVPCIQY